VPQGTGLLYAYGIAGFDIIIISSTWQNNNFYKADGVVLSLMLKLKALDRFITF